MILSVIHQLFSLGPNGETSPGLSVSNPIKQTIENIAEKSLSTPPVIDVPAKTRVYSKKLPATEKLQKQLQFARNEQKAEKAKGFKWDSNVKCEYEIKPDHSQELKAGITSAQGRRKEMEDTHLATKIVFKVNSTEYQGELYGIFDGHGGIDVACLLSGSLKSVLETELNESVGEAPSDEMITEALTQAFLKIQKVARETCEDGATATCAFIFNGKVYVPNVGDARTIIIKKEETIQLSEDAKPLNKRFHKQINAVPNADHHIMRFTLDKVTKARVQIEYNISRKENLRELKENEMDIGRICSNKTPNSSLAMARTIGDPKFQLSGKPKITTINKEEEDILVLACDGLWDVASTDEVGLAVKAMIAQGLNETQIAEQLITTALLHGTNDNVSVIVVKK